MNLAFLLHIYQPPTQDGKIIRQIAESCYFPIFKTLKNHSEVKLTFNIPLSLLAKLHELGYDELIKLIKTLYEEERIEVVSSAAYHSLLSRVSSNVLEEQVILNEYGLGYYLGNKKGFEGENAIMLKNVKGFFPPEMAVNLDVVNKLDELGYEWVLVDEVGIDLAEKKPVSVYGLENKSIKVVTRNTNLSNILSFKRDIKVDDFIDEVIRLRQYQDTAIVALDGEFFGHHNENGIYILSTLIEKLGANDIDVVSVSELLETADEEKISTIIESTWAADHNDIADGHVYTMWDIPENDIQKMLWQIFDDVVASAPSSSFSISKNNDTDTFDIETMPIWEAPALEKIADITLRNEILKLIMFLQSLHSDQFWWASKKTVGDKEMYDPQFIKKALELYVKYALMRGDKDLLSKIQLTSERILKQL